MLVRQTRSARPHGTSAIVGLRTLVPLGLGAALALSGSIVRADDQGKGASDIAVHTKTAIKLAGLVTFVAGSCPELKPDYARFKTAIAALGLTVEDLAKPEMKNAYLAYVLRYKEDTKGNCALAQANFGPGGKIVPDIFAKQAAGHP